MSTTTTIDAAPAYAKPLPAIHDGNRPYFEAGREGKLKLQQCDHCTNLWYPYAQHCPRCLSTEYHWQALSGRARLWSWTVMHQLYIKSFKDDLPYVVAFVELEEGPEMISTVIGVDRAELRCDQPLEVTFRQVKDDVWLPMFRPATAA